MARLELEDGAAVRLRSPHGSFEGRLMRAPIKPGNLEVHWPEGMPLLAGDVVDPDSMEPDYNATVTVEPLYDPEGAPARSPVEDLQSAGATNLSASATSPAVSATSTYKPT